MEYRFLVAILVLLVVALHHQVEAEFNYNRYLPKESELAELNLKCIPGRTVIKISEKPVIEEESETDDDDMRRSHMTFTTDDETCQVCVCSAEGKDIYCSKRPAKNVNECIRITTLDDAMHKGIAMEHDRDLATRIRRDLIWHKDEIPYRDHAKCKRGMSYYTNSMYANDTDIDVPPDIDSLLDYSNTDVCFFCICHTHGEYIACIPRNPWYCQYYRDMRNPDYARNSYRILLEQDRPAYFRQLSYRLRRTMDSGMFDLMDAVGAGNKEQYCVPFVSTYTDCNEANQCDGCKKCKCSAAGQWECEQVRECLGQADDDSGELPNDLDIDLALEAMVDEMKEKEKAEKRASANPLVPLPEKPAPVETLLDHKEYDVEDEILALMNSDAPPTNLRNVRAAEGKNTNGSVQFFNIKDDINEDTLKAENISGTLKATRMVPLTHITRRSGLLLNSSSKFQIEYTPPKMYQPLTDNKIDTPHDAKVNNEAHDKVSGIIGNYSQVVKNKDISKVVVSELSGDEVIGTVGGPVISNITFQPDNSTSAAIALIAGTLLYHLWNMEQNGTTENIDLDQLKHERISSLLEMFREPLNIKQETFLKDALVKISSAFDKNKMVENVSICQNIPLNDNKSDQELESEEVFDQSNETNHETTTKVPNSKYIADLIQKYNAVQETLKKLKLQTQRKNNKEAEQSAQTQKPSFNKFGTMLQTIFQELMPKKGSENVVNRMNNMNVLTEADAVKLKLKKLYNIDIGNISVSAKDRIVLDYLTHIQNKPKCVLDIKKPAPVPTLESNILLNLSEFFKIKSMSDLIKLIKVEDKVEKAIENEENKSHLIAPNAKTESIDKPFFRTFDTQSEPKVVKKDNKSSNKVQIESNKTLDEAKNKLRQDLLTIVEDLVELRKMKGQTVDTNDVKLTELLPCVSNLFDDKKTTNKATVNTDTNVNTNKNFKPSDQVKMIVDALSKETKFTQTRRTNSWSGPRPKSAVVWNRILTAVQSRRNNTRRNMRSNEPKSIKEIKEMIKKLESSNSNSFKRYAYLHEVPPSERLLLLRTFESDTQKYIHLLSSIKAKIDTISKLPTDEYSLIEDFIEDASKSINFNEKVINNLDKVKKPNLTPSVKVQLANDNNMKSLRLPKLREITSTKKITRDQIINQVIRNRIQQYIQNKEASDRFYFNDITYDIAKKILVHLELGNHQLARELFKIFVSEKQKSASVDDGNKDDGTLTLKNWRTVHSRPKSIEPLVEFRDPKLAQDKDQIIKQLLSLRNIKF